jgi:hypothetical protein
MKPAAAKAKGRRCAQETKDLLLKSCRLLEDADIVVTPSGVTGPDLHFSPRASKMFPFTVECKNREAMNIWEALAQAEAHKGAPGSKPVLFFKRNRSELYVSMKAEDLMQLLLSRKVS